MILLDTDHLTVLSFVEDSRFGLLTGRMQAARHQLFGATVISLEEQTRGWLAEIHRQREVHRQVIAYERFAKLFQFYRKWEVVPFDERAADEFSGLRKQRIRIGTQDLKIAAIALVNDALLLSANVRDFQQVPGLRVENWLE
jgi:tRNA(fMet)-specific endonuclease VapC